MFREAQSPVVNVQIKHNIDLLELTGSDFFTEAEFLEYMAGLEELGWSGEEKVEDNNVMDQIKEIFLKIDQDNSGYISKSVNSIRCNI